MSVSGDDSREGGIEQVPHKPPLSFIEEEGRGGCGRGRPGVGCWGGVILHCPPPRGLEHTGDWGLVQEPHGGCCFLSQLIPPF